MKEASLKTIRVAESTKKRILELRENSEETYNDVLKRCLGVPLENYSQFSRFAVIDCSLTGEKCYGDAQCNSCEIGLNFIEKSFEKGSI